MGETVLRTGKLQEFDGVGGNVERLQKVEWRDRHFHQRFICLCIKFLLARVKVVNEHFADERMNARALVIVQGGRIVYEKYASGFRDVSKHIGWSMTKVRRPPCGYCMIWLFQQLMDAPQSIMNALIGLRVGDGVISLNDTVDITAWKGRSLQATQVAMCGRVARMEQAALVLADDALVTGADDGRQFTTIDNLLRMVDGLDFDEEYYPGGPVTQMVFT